MTNVNKILLLFLTVIMTSFLLIWEFVQSKTFADILSKNVTKYSKEILGADLSFERVEFKLFPPGVEVNNVLLEKKEGKNFLKTNVSGLGISFDVLDLFETDLTIDKLYLKDGIVEVRSEVKNNKKDNNNEKKPSDFKISELLKTIRAKLPFTLRNIYLEKIELSYNENSIITHTANVEIRRTDVAVGLVLRNFNLAQMKLYEEIVDEVKLDVIVEDETIVINELLLTKNMSKVSLSGEVDDYLDIDKLEWEVEGEVNTPLPVLHEYLEFSQVGKLESGFLNINFESQGSISDYDVDANIKGKEIVTDFADAKSLELSTSIDKNQIIFKNFELKHKGGELSLSKPFEFFNFNSKKFVEENVFVKTNKLKLTNALKFLKESLSILQGDVTGNIEFILGPNDFHFLLKNDVYVEDLKLVTSADSPPILNPKRINLTNTRFDIVGSDVSMNIKGKINNTEFTTKGSISNGGARFELLNGKIDLSELGKISGFSLLGKGKFDLGVLVNERRKELRIKPLIENFSFEGYRQDSLGSNITIDLSKNELNVMDIEGKLGRTETSGFFKLNFNDLSVESKIRQEKILVSDLKKIYQPALKDINILSDKVYGDWATEVILGGKLSLNDLIVSGQFVGQNNFVFGESLELIQLKYKLEKAKLSLSDVFFTKSGGAIHGGMNLDLISNNLLYWGNINKIPINEINNYASIPLTLRGNVSGVFKGSIVDKKLNMDSELNISESRIHGRKTGDTYITVKASESVIDYSASLLGKVFTTSGTVYLNKNKNRSQVKWAIDSNDLNKVLSIFSFVDHLKTGFYGALKLQGDASFHIDDIKNSSANLKVEKMAINKGIVKLDYKNRDGAQISVVDGKIKKWDLNIRGKKFFINSKGEGDINSRYDIKTRLKSDATLLEVFNVLISKASGTLLGSIHNYKNLFEEDYEAKLVSNNLTMNSDFAPVALRRGDLLLTYKQKKLYLKKLKAQLNSGALLVNGEVDLARVIPDINIRYEFLNAGIPILKKSALTFSGKGSLVGKTFPYTLGGEIQVEKCNIVNEITDFIGGNEIIKNDIDFLPKDKTVALNQYLNFNINVNTLEPIRITNSLADLGFTGNVILTGGEKEPRLAGKISLAPLKNQIFFKNNTFELSKGNIFFYERNKVTNPELDFLATSVINKYNVSIGVLGPLQEFKMDLVSDPLLSQSDILSLIAFGYTEDLSTNLSDSERESMTRAGVGSIIFDRFKINETLKNEFGLQVNLGTEIEQEEGSYLSQRNAEGGDIGRVRSATTVEIKKQISESIDLSVSSTVGGTVGQRQSMNLNYNLNKNLSVEGVYESNTQVQSEELRNDSSVGADVKIRWSFK